MPQEYSFSLPYDAFDLELIGLGPETVGGDEFLAKVPQFFIRQFAEFGAKARVVLNDRERTIAVSWWKEREYRDPKKTAIQLADSGRVDKALPLLWTLHRENPNDPDVLYHLAKLHGDLGRHAKSAAMMRQLVEQAPDYVEGHVGLGVALKRLSDMRAAESAFRAALRLRPQHLPALLHLGSCLMEREQVDEASDVFERAVAVAPNDVRGLLALAQCYEAAGRVDDADDHYLRAIEVGTPIHAVDFAKERRSAIAQAKLRRGGMLRPDVAMYIADALERFESMTLQQVRSLGYEIALLGQRGLDINDPDRKYSLRSLPGKFSGLQLCSIMYASFKRFAPGEDVGIDFSAEYEEALAMRQSMRKSGGG